MDNENNFIISRYAFERMQTKDENIPRLEEKLFRHI